MFQFLKRLRDHLLNRTTSSAVAEPKYLFVFVRIPEALQPTERSARYADPIDKALQSQALGEVSGGGSQLTQPDEQGHREIAWIGIDVDLVVQEQERGISVLRAELKKLGAPPGTILEVHYVAGIQEFELFAPVPEIPGV